MQTSRKICALSFMPDMRLAYERIVSEARDILHILEKRFFAFTQQQFSFIVALNRCREMAFEPAKEIGSIAQVAHYSKNIARHTTDKRILKMFLVLIRDLQEFRRTLVRLSKQHDERLEAIFEKWKRLLEPTQDISKLRTRYPNTQLNYLSIDERLNHFGGIISVMPMAMDCARDALRRIELTRVYRPIKTTKYPKKEIYETSKVQPRRPCIERDRDCKPGRYCRRAPSPSSTLSSPVPSLQEEPRRAASIDLNINQIQDCKVHRTLNTAEGNRCCRDRKENRRYPLAWDPDMNATEMNKCLWRDKTCSEEFISKMLDEKRKRDRKMIHCKY